MDLYRNARALLFAMDAERAHGLTIATLAALPAGRPAAHDPRLAVSVAGIDFPSPLGLAAGFDKDARACAWMLRMGFSFVEIGTVTPQPQPGNPRPRLFRLVEDEAIINRMGFNNKGLAVARAQLSRRAAQPGIVGANVGANKDSSDRLGDYVAGIRALGPLTRYVTLNISSPNTPGLRELQTGDHLRELVDRIAPAKAEIGVPIFLKVAPDLSPGEIMAVADVLKATSTIDALIVSNTTIGRPETLRSASRGEQGGLSGAPLKPLALDTLRAFRRALGAGVPLIGVGGIGSAQDAYDRIRAGASLVQLYTDFAYQGPALIREIHEGLIALLQRDGFASIAHAVGVDA